MPNSSHARRELTNTSSLILSLYWLLESVANLRQNACNLKWCNKTQFTQPQLKPNITIIASNHKTIKKSKMYLIKIALAGKVTNLVNSI